MQTRTPTGRKPNEIRPFSIETGVNRYAEGSVLVQAGFTKVLCTASVEATTPEWLKGKGRGWVTAEYSMLPRSTHTRSKRERDGKVSGRTHEIQRLIGRALRTCVDLEKLGERSILIDCDVIQADGGTRTAAISGSCIALALALKTLIKADKISPLVWVDSVAAVSVGLSKKNGTSLVLVDLDYEEDSQIDVDFNYVLTGQGNVVEVQGTAEKGAFSREELNLLLDQAHAGALAIQRHQQNLLKQIF